MGSLGIRFAAVVMALGSLVACMGGSETPTEVPAPAPDAPVEVAPEPVAPKDAFLVGRTTLRKTASDEKKIPDPAGGDKTVSNFVTTLDRGEQVQVMGTDGEWTQVKLSDGKDGWLKTNRVVLVGPNTQVATLFTPGKVFTRPDLLSLETDKSLEAGGLLFVLQTKDQFSEVDWPKSAVSNSTAWTLSSELVTDPNEVAAAKLIMKVRQLRADNDPAAAQMEELTRSQFASSQLLKLLDQPAPVEAPPGEGAPVEGAAPTTP